MDNPTIEGIIADIYVEAHLKEEPNAVIYTGSLCPKEMEVVKKATTAIKELVRERVEKMKKRECTTHGEIVLPCEFFCDNCKYDNALTDILKLVEGL